MKAKKLNIGVSGKVGAWSNLNQSRCKDIIRDAHNQGKLLDMKIKDFPIIKEYLENRQEKKRWFIRKEEIEKHDLKSRLLYHLKKIVPYDSTSQCDIRHGKVTDYKPKEKLWVIQDEGILETKRKNWYYHASWFCGRCDGHYFTHRIPANISKVYDAIYWIKPAAVKKAEEKGKRIMRQGDVWFIESNYRSDNTKDLPYSHNYDEITRDVKHQEHGTLHVPFNFRAYQSKSINGKSD